MDVVFVVVDGVVVFSFCRFLNISLPGCSSCWGSGNCHPHYHKQRHLPPPPPLMTLAVPLSLSLPVPLSLSLASTQPWSPINLTLRVEDSRIYSVPRIVLHSRIGACILREGEKSRVFFNAFIMEVVVTEIRKL